MISITRFDQMIEDHTARVARVNRDGWKIATAPSGGTRAHGIATVVALVRQQVGVALIGIGAWLQGTPARQATESGSV